MSRPLGKRRHESQTPSGSKSQLSTVPTAGWATRQDGVDFSQPTRLRSAHHVRPRKANLSSGNGSHNRTENLHTIDPATLAFGPSRQKSRVDMPPAQRSSDGRAKDGFDPRELTEFQHLMAAAAGFHNDVLNDDHEFNECDENSVSPCSGTNNCAAPNRCSSPHDEGNPCLDECAEEICNDVDCADNFSDLECCDADPCPRACPWPSNHSEADNLYKMLCKSCEEDDFLPIGPPHSLRPSTNIPSQAETHDTDAQRAHFQPFPLACSHIQQSLQNNLPPDNNGTFSFPNNSPLHRGSNTSVPIGADNTVLHDSGLITESFDTDQAYQPASVEPNTRDRTLLNYDQFRDDCRAVFNQYIAHPRACPRVIDRILSGEMLDGQQHFIPQSTQVQPETSFIPSTNNVPSSISREASTFLQSGANLDTALSQNMLGYIYPPPGSGFCCDLHHSTGGPAYLALPDFVPLVHQVKLVENMPYPNRGWTSLNDPAGNQHPVYQFADGQTGGAVLLGVQQASPFNGDEHVVDSPVDSDSTTHSPTASYSGESSAVDEQVVDAAVSEASKPIRFDEAERFVGLLKDSSPVANATADGRVGKSSPSKAKQTSPSNASDGSVCRWKVGYDQVCGSRFTDGMALQEHVANVHVPALKREVDGDYHCGWERCTFRSGDGRAKVTRHNKTHTHAKGYTCPYSGCHYTSAEKQQLELHKRTHTGEKPHECIVCHQRFSNKSQLANHFRLHTGEKPYRCPHCDHCSGDISNLNKHKKKRHPELCLTFKCADCDTSFMSEANYDRHVRNGCAKQQARIDSASETVAGKSKAVQSHGISQQAF